MVSRRFVQNRTKFDGSFRFHGFVQRAVTSNTAGRGILIDPHDRYS